jgi:uncharacterized membrane protein
VLLQPHSLSLSAIAPALRDGWRTFRRDQGIGLVIGAVFAALGSLLLWAVVALDLAPMGVHLLGGFLLLGPVVMAGLLGVRRAVALGRTPTWRDALAAWRASPSGLGALALFCGLIFFIWLGDAGTLYSFLVGEGGGGQTGLLPFRTQVLPFHLTAGVTGSVLALIVFVVTVHAVPLLASRRAHLVTAIVASVRAVFRSPLAHAGWALILAAGIFVCLLAPPLLILSLPLMAYAGHALHLEVFPSE